MTSPCAKFSIFCNTIHHGITQCNNSIYTTKTDSCYQVRNKTHANTLFISQFSLIFMYFIILYTNSQLETEKRGCFKQPLCFIKFSFFLPGLHCCIRTVYDLNCLRLLRRLTVCRPCNISCQAVYCDLRHSTLHSITNIRCRHIRCNTCFFSSSFDRIDCIVSISCELVWCFTVKFILCSSLQSLLSGHLLHQRQMV